HKAWEAHWAHLVIHGTLHLLGFDHAVAAQATEMEQVERALLQVLGYSDPYLFSNGQ
ncbi:MAG: rRNA maturation RNase YbeY, partial [Gammaproteobacteria bacterium]